MTLPAGTRLGPYEILTPIGAGGMGEVYRARDSKLKREVAIKVLPESLSKDPEALSRFEREAYAVAALSHPNILSIFDFGRESGVAYAVTEFLEGGTLRDRLAAGRIREQQAVDYALQIARGLSAAHEKGIVHRDLKPENVFVTKDGHVKILDFGLAKKSELAPREDETSAATASRMTEPGLVMGTVGYMSPEQVRGLTVDHRSDIFSFGAILYEMLSGKRAFRRDTAVDTMSAILKEEPLELLQIVPEVPRGLGSIVGRCLEKQVEGRFRSAFDLALTLEAISASGRTAALMQDPGGSFSKEPFPSFKRLTFRRGSISGARFSPDGHSVVYGAAWEGRPFEIFTSRPESPESRSLGLPSADLLAVSPSGEMAVSLDHRHKYEWKASGTLARVSLSGGGVRLMLADVRQADWSPDGRSLAVIREVSGRDRLEYPVGQVLWEHGAWLSQPRISRDGQLVAFVEHPVAGDNGGSVCVVDDAGRKQTLTALMPCINGVAWSRDGQEVWYSAISDGLICGLWSVDRSGRSRQRFASIGRVKLRDIAPGGRMLLVAQMVHLATNVLSEGDPSEKNLSWFDGTKVNDISDDGKWLLFSEELEAENPRYAAFLRSTDGSAAVRLGEGVGTRLSPDGRWALAVLFFPESDLLIYPTGLGETRSLRSEEIRSYIWAGWHPDGERVFVIGTSADPSPRLYLQDLRGGVPRLVTDLELDAAFTIGVPISRDGSHVVLRQRGGQLGLLTVESGELTPLLGAEPNDLPIRFDAHGRSLFVARVSEGAPRIESLDLATGKRTTCRDLRPPDPTGILSIFSVVCTPNGESYAYSHLSEISVLYLVEGLA
jgi:eukaryotic-like serine/threonine-protein kinase